MVIQRLSSEIHHRHRKQRWPDVAGVERQRLEDSVDGERNLLQVAARLDGHELRDPFAEPLIVGNMP